ncbi:hypothetical protein GWI33_013231 [Rhynchophorus ferrugineus]|uniref:Uncharacterized protein n=1 Tax=Rhynchophorus ferrugineus TaxID=354439 RepID=A0A834I7J0_RHYFE|nr:hypothetical protein GWI33_013231 [Rhynchophorus ferrugineus]
MYEETALPIRSKLRISSGSNTRIYFIRNSTSRSLIFLKYFETIISLFCLGLAIATFNILLTNIMERTILFGLNSCSLILTTVEILYLNFNSYIPVILQVLNSFINSGLFLTCVILLHRSQSSHVIMKTMTITNGTGSIVCLVDFICKIVISIYLNQTTRIKTVKDVGVSAFMPFPLSHKPRQPRSVVTATPITYGGTFPIGKDQPPFLAQDRNPPKEIPYYNDKGNRYKNNYKYEFDEYFTLERLPKNKIIQTHLEQENKSTTTTFATLHLEEERRKKSPWTCSTPTSSRKFEAKKYSPMSTPITYSGTFAVNKELVPITPQNISLSESPRISPRTTNRLHKKAKEGFSSKSEGSSPRRLGNISEERFSQTLSSGNCSMKRSNRNIVSNTTLPGLVLDDVNYIQHKRMKLNEIKDLPM